MVVNVSAIIVTHNSESYLDRCVERLSMQSYPVSEIVIVDSGSVDTDYLSIYQSRKDIKLIFKKNIGFSVANNLGYSKSSKLAQYILFLNPDTFIEEDLIETAVEKMQENIQLGVLSGRLLGYDIDSMEPNGCLDSTGILRKKYGKWYDRGRGARDIGQFMEEEEVPALCGALLFCRKEALESLGQSVFDEDFFLYKEDIEFSLRIRKYGWKLLYFPKLLAYHCRGWQSRSKIPYFLKKTAAESEILLYKKHPSPYIFWAYLKYWLVTLLRL